MEISDKKIYKLQDVMDYYGVKKGKAYKIMREAKRLSTGDSSRGILGSNVLHYSELELWDKQLGLEGMAGIGRPRKQVAAR